MPTTITAPADQPLEKATYAVTFSSFVDETGAAATPTAATWTLTDRSGNVINGRSAVSITPASSITVLLSGNDLSLPAGDNGKRALLLEWTYTSTLGSNLPGKDVLYFTVQALDGVS